MKSMSKYVAGTGELSPYPSGWIILHFLGQRAYTQGHVVLVGRPPGKQRSPLTPSADKVEKALARRTKPARPIGYDEPEFTGWPRVVWLENVKYPINATYYDHILSRYPDAVFLTPLGGNPNNPIPIKSGKEIVGAIMAIRM